MDMQNKTITELTLDQMDKVSGGAGEFPPPPDPLVQNNYNTGSVPGYEKCPVNPWGEHEWTDLSENCKECRHCRLHIYLSPSHRNN